jgi:hypothetical protein
LWQESGCLQQRQWRKFFFHHRNCLSRIARLSISASSCASLGHPHALPRAAARDSITFIDVISIRALRTVLRDALWKSRALACEEREWKKGGDILIGFSRTGHSALCECKGSRCARSTQVLYIGWWSTKTQNFWTVDAANQGN